MKIKVVFIWGFLFNAYRPEDWFPRNAELCGIPGWLCPSFGKASQNLYGHDLNINGWLNICLLVTMIHAYAQATTTNLLLGGCECVYAMAIVCMHTISYQLRYITFKNPLYITFIPYYYYISTCVYVDRCRSSDDFMIRLRWPRQRKVLV